VSTHDLILSGPYTVSVRPLTSPETCSASCGLPGKHRPRHGRPIARPGKLLTDSVEITRHRPGSQVTIADASYGGEEGRCQMGAVTCVGGIAVGWTSQRQPVVALHDRSRIHRHINWSTLQQAAWMKGCLSELGEDVTLAIVTDNDGTRKLGKNPGFHKRKKHINQRYHYIRQLELELTIEWRAGKCNEPIY